MPELTMRQSPPGKNSRVLLGEPEPRWTSEQVNGFVSRTGLAVASIAKLSSTPIVIRQGGLPRQHGTGTFIRVAERYFLVTAHHVVQPGITRPGRARLSIFDDNPVNEVILSGRVYCAPDP